MNAKFRAAETENAFLREELHELQQELHWRIFVGCNALLGHESNSLQEIIVINILGYMQVWGLNIDSVTVIMLVIALGLAVDYSAHIGRNFLEKHGHPNDRMRLTLQDMGVAVFHGAMSTMVAVLVLGSSDSYVFMTFFKQLFLCISLGLAHGLILLPVCLSLCNPNPYDDLGEDF